jgi:hypothetical protein
MNNQFLNILQDRPRNFSEFHALASKSMPDAVQYPEQYSLCLALMKLSWNAAVLSCSEAINEKL